MNINKKIIAREFLLLVSLLLIILITFFYIRWHNYQIDLEAVEMGKVAEKYDGVDFDEFLDVLEKGDFKDWNDVKKLKEKKYSMDESLVIYKKIALWYFIFIYPIRFLAMGTIWSISTLRQKEKVN